MISVKNSCAEVFCNIIHVFSHFDQLKASSLNKSINLFHTISIIYFINMYNLMYFCSIIVLRFFIMIMWGIINRI